MMWAPPSTPSASARPFFRTLPLEQHGLTWVHPDAPLAHPLDDGVGVLEHSFEVTKAGLGVDAEIYDTLLRPLVRDWEKLMQ